MKKGILVVTLAIVALGGASFAQANMLTNGSFENGTSPWITAANFKYADIWFGPPGGYDPSFGDWFSFINAEPNDARQYTQQNTPHQFEAGASYTLSGVAMEGSNPWPDDPSAIILQIGYLTDLFDNNSFEPLATAQYDVTADWAEYSVALDNVDAQYAGEYISVRWRAHDFDAVPGGQPNDIWADAFVLTPEPASFLLLALGALIRRR